MRCILVVDDDESVRNVVSDALIDAGFLVAKAANGEAALDHVREHMPDAIVLDLMMPVMDGWTFLDTLQSRDIWTNIPIAIMSGASTAERTADARGVQVSVGKPFALDELLQQVERLTAR